MSKPNKANKGRYVQAGRLSPDDLARERMKQQQVSAHAGERDELSGKAPAREPGSGAPASSPPKSAPEE
jgi:hypothetical protein